MYKDLEEWENGLKDAFYGDFSDYSYIDAKYEDVKDFVLAHSLSLIDQIEECGVPIEEMRVEGDKFLVAVKHPNNLLVLNKDKFDALRKQYSDEKEKGV